MKENPHFVPFSVKLFLTMFIFILMFMLSMILGAADISVSDVWKAIATNVTGDKILIIHEIRLPREIGAALAVSGAIMQGITKNPLADPELLGLTAGANAALAITIAFFPAANYFIIMLVCFAGVAIGVMLVFGVSSLRKGGYTPFRIVLAGAAISAFLTAIAEGVGILFRISKQVSMWTAGGLIGTSWNQLKIIGPVILLGLIAANVLSKQITILSLGDEVAVGLGQNTVRTKIILFAAVTILTGASVALVGNIAFIGLIIPHMVTAAVGNDYRYILLVSYFMGAALMLFSDTLGRIINAPYETPVAAIISMVGLPFFLFIVHKGGKIFS